MGRGGEEEDIIESSMISSKKTQMEKLTCLPVTKREYAQKAKNKKKKTKISGSIVSIRFPFEQVGEAARRHIYAVCFTSCVSISAGRFAKLRLTVLLFRVSPWQIQKRLFFSVFRLISSFRYFAYVIKNLYVLQSFANSGKRASWGKTERRQERLLALFFSVSQTL